MSLEEMARHYATTFNWFYGNMYIEGNNKPDTLASNEDAI